MVEETTFTITADGEEDEVTIPAGLVDMLSEGGDTAPQVIGDLALFGCAQRIHGAVHHGPEEVDEETKAIEEATLDQFEDRFGLSFGEATGHSH